MNILIVSQRYWPENFRITDIAESLQSFGHDVTVLCGLPNYPSGYIFDGYKHKKNRRQYHNGVKIIRATEIGRRNNIFFRIFNYLSFPFFGTKIIKQFDDNFDVVFVNGLSPITSAKPAVKYAKKFKKPLIMYEMDLWPESLLAGGVKKDSFLYNFYKKVSWKIYSQFDEILVSTEEHIDYIKALPNCSEINVDFLPQYCESIFENVSFGAVDNGVIDLMFAGNIGKAQSVETIIKAANILKDDPRFKFHIIGDGSELNNVKRLAFDLKTHNVVFYGERPLEEMPSLYKLADAMLVTLEDKSYANMTIPGKVQSYMAAGKPIICSANGSTSNFLKKMKCGLTCSAENYSELAKIIKSIDNKSLIKLGLEAKKSYEKINKQVFFSHLLSYINKIFGKLK